MQRPTEVLFYMKNHGKTQAIIKARTFTLQYVADTDRPASLRVEPFESGPVVIAGGAAEPRQSDEFLVAELGNALTVEEIKRLADGIFVLLFVGRVLYEDMFGAEHETRVCWRYDPTANRLVSHGGDEFNQRT